jgi:hypothetical protein
MTPSGTPIPFLLYLFVVSAVLAASAIWIGGILSSWFPISPRTAMPIEGLIEWIAVIAYVKCGGPIAPRWLVRFFVVRPKPGDRAGES